MSVQAVAAVGKTTYTPMPAPPPAVASAPRPSMPAPKAPSGGGYGRGGAAAADYDGLDDAEYAKTEDYYGGEEVDEPAPGIDYDTLRRSTMAQAKSRDHRRPDPLPGSSAIG